MEKFFLGGNTAHGFFGFHDGELKRYDNVILLKGAPGTGKSTIIKAVGAECAKRGLDHEMWYCSGDPSSADGILVKELSAVVTDATPPHPCEATLPVVRERLFDTAAALDRGKLLDKKGRIEKLIADKKACYAHAYDKLKSAFCHYKRAEEEFARRADEVKIRRAAAAFALRECAEEGGADPPRHLFSSAITSEGRVRFFEHLAGRRVHLVTGDVVAARIFIGEAARLIPSETVLHDPLVPERAEGVLFGRSALVCDAGPFAAAADRTEAWGGEASAAEERELSLAEEDVKSAARALADAKEAHAEVERIHLAAMDFGVTDGILRRVKEYIFGGTV